jgi:integrase
MIAGAIRHWVSGVLFGLPLRDLAGLSARAPAAELCSLRWTQIDLRQVRLHVNRAKGGCASVHPLHGPELRALRPLQGTSPYVFVTEAGTPVTTAWFLRMVQRTGRAARFAFGVHPHMLRHSTGYKEIGQNKSRSVALGDRRRSAAGARPARSPLYERARTSRGSVASRVISRLRLAGTQGCGPVAPFTTRSVHSPTAESGRCRNPPRLQLAT